MNLLTTLCSSWRSLRSDAQHSPRISSDAPHMQVLRRLRRRTQPRGLGSCYRKRITSLDTDLITPIVLRPVQPLVRRRDQLPAVAARLRDHCGQADADSQA